MIPSIIVHGGAWNIPEKFFADNIKGCEGAVLEGWRILENGGKALDAVERAVNALEDNPVFNAGLGAYPNEAGKIELDALIMEGEHLKAGAVAALRNVKNPVSVARKIMEETHHVLLVGEGANAFAERMGFSRYSDEELISKHIKDKTVNLSLFRAVRGTVGAVAIDSAGNLAAATSTGGTLYKSPGRVGDSPLVGCGAYADNDVGAVSATGWGEAIMRLVLAKTVSTFLENHLSPGEAAKKAIHLLERKVGGLAGVISIDSLGRIGFSYNTEHMVFSYIDGGKLYSSI